MTLTKSEILLLELGFPPRPSNCNHFEVQTSDNKTICYKCGRIRELDLENKLFVFKFCNNVPYLIRRFK